MIIFYLISLNNPYMSVQFKRYSIANVMDIYHSFLKSFLLFYISDNIRVSLIRFNCTIVISIQEIICVYWCKSNLASYSLFTLMAFWLLICSLFTLFALLVDDRKIAKKRVVLNSPRFSLVVLNDAVLIVPSSCLPSKAIIWYPSNICFYQCVIF